MSETIAIIGAGPAGCALACFLVERGIECLVFDDEKKPSLLVGESLVPAAIPIIQRLGVESEVAAISALKLGAALRHGSGSPRVDFAFQKIGKGIPEYAYNIPRPQFDKILRDRAETLGARFIKHKASVVATVDDDKRELELSDESLTAAGLTRTNQPNQLIDATGRARLFSRVLKIGAHRGPRNDVAHFAHFKNYPSDSNMEGQIVISVLECGWSWQIPLRDKMSVGVVFSSKGAVDYGSTAAVRLENVMKHNSVLNKPGIELVSDVMTYSNYQLVSKQGFGKGWILLGDALGFVDPMLSPGVFLTLESATLLDDLVFKHGYLSEKKRTRQLNTYYQEMRNWHAAWSKLISYFYDGRMLSLGEIRPVLDKDESIFSLRRQVDQIISKLLSQLVTGAGTRSKFHHAALFQICRHLTSNEMHQNYSIRDVPE